MKRFLLLLYAVMAFGAAPGMLPDAFANTPVLPPIREEAVPPAVAAKLPVVKEETSHKAANPSAGQDQGDESEATKATQEDGGSERMDRRAGLFILILQIFRVQR